MNVKTNIICAGLIGWDTIARTQFKMGNGADLPGFIETNLGGVIANIAVALKNNAQDKIDLEVTLLSAVGNDQRSKQLLSILSKDSSSILLSLSSSDFASPKPLAENAP